MNSKVIETLNQNDILLGRGGKLSDANHQFEGSIIVRLYDLLGFYYQMTAQLMSFSARNAIHDCREQ